MQRALNHSQEARAPVCLSCGNRSLFLLDTVQGCSGVTIDRMMVLPDLTSVRCGRCRCRNCIVVEYDD